jgi:hypothetical protein
MVEIYVTFSSPTQQSYNGTVNGTCSVGQVSTRPFGYADTRYDSSRYTKHQHDKRCFHFVDCKEYGIYIRSIGSAP